MLGQVDRHPDSPVFGGRAELIANQLVALDDSLSCCQNIVERMVRAAVFEQQGGQLVDLLSGNLEELSIAEGLHSALLSRHWPGIKLDAGGRCPRFGWSCDLRPEIVFRASLNST